MLDIAGAALTAAGIPFVRLDGSCSAARRAEMLREFADASPGAPRVFLASLKAGGVGMWVAGPLGRCGRAFGVSGGLPIEWEQ